MVILNAACFTGHRPQHLPINPANDKEGFSRLLKELENKILYIHKSLGITDFISGMALGVDTYAAKAVLNLRDSGLNVRLICAIPCRSQDIFWGPKLQQQYKMILRQADRVFCLSDAYTESCMQERNVFMVNNSAIVLAVWDGTNGGTANAVKYAKKSGVPVIRINPLDYKTKESKM